MIKEFPKDCFLIEWNRDEQKFSRNAVRNGVLDRETNNRIVRVVGVFANEKVANTIITYIKKYFTQEGKELTELQVQFYIGESTRFADTYAKQK